MNQPQYQNTYPYYQSQTYQTYTSNAPTINGCYVATSNGKSLGYRPKPY